jgi:hypothetical protein
VAGTVRQPCPSATCSGGAQVKRELLSALAAITGKKIGFNRGDHSLIVFDLDGDLLHWGEGRVLAGARR